MLAIGLEAAESGRYRWLRLTNQRRVMAAARSGLGNGERPDKVMVAAKFGLGRRRGQGKH